MSTADWVEAVLCLACLPLLIILQFFVFPKYHHRDFPGPKPSSYLTGNADLFLRERRGSMPQIMVRFAQKYGPVYQLWLMHRRLVVVTDALDARFITTTKNFPKSPVFVDVLKECISESSLLIASKNSHRGIRKSIIKQFNGHFLDVARLHMLPELRQFVLELDALSTSTANEAGDHATEALDLDKRLVRLLLNVMGRNICGKPLGYDFSKSTELILTQLYRKFAMYPYETWRNRLFPSRNEPLRKAQEFCLSFADNIIAARKAETYMRNGSNESAAPKDLLDLFLRIPDVSDDFLRSQVVTFFIAGHDTTAHTLAFLFYELANAPEVVSRMRGEIADVCGNADFALDESAFPTVEQIKCLRYCNQVWQETLRLHPVAATGTFRYVDEDCTLPSSGLSLDAGTSVIVPVYPIHRSTQYWGDDANEFRPDRFSPEAIRARGNLGNLCFLPFSLGPRNCVGQFLANFEAMIILAILIPRFDFELACNRDDVLEFHAFTMKTRTKDPDGQWIGLPVHVRRRGATV